LHFSKFLLYHADAKLSWGKLGAPRARTRKERAMNLKRGMQGSPGSLPLMEQREKHKEIVTVHPTAAQKTRPSTPCKEVRSGKSEK
jgi:hypothetical protein